MAYRDVILAESSLVNYYELESDGADSKGTNTGTVNGSLAFVSGGIAGNCASFDGVNDFIAITRSIGDDFSIEFWLNTTAAGPAGSGFSQGWGIVNACANTGGAQDYGVNWMDVGQVDSGVGGGTVKLTDSPLKNYNDGKWHHVVFTRNKAVGSLKLWIDGYNVQSATGASTSTLSAVANIHIGKLEFAASGFFTGKLDEVALYNAVLTQDQIRAHYAAGGGRVTFDRPRQTALVVPGSLRGKLATALKFYSYVTPGGVARDVVTNRQAVLTSVGLGTGPFGSNLTFASASTMKAVWPSPNSKVSPNKLTLFAVCRVDVAATSRTSIVSNCGDNISGVCLYYFTGYLGLRKNNVNDNLSTTVPVALGEWVAIAASFDPTTGAVTYWQYSYDQVSGQLWTGTSSQSVGSGNATDRQSYLGFNTASSDAWSGAILCGGIAERLWSQDDFITFVNDPFAPIRLPGRGWLSSFASVPVHSSGDGKSF